MGWAGHHPQAAFLILSRLVLGLLCPHLQNGKAAEAGPLHWHTGFPWGSQLGLPLPRPEHSRLSGNSGDWPGRVGSGCKLFVCYREFWKVREGKYFSPDQIFLVKLGEGILILSLCLIPWLPCILSLSLSLTFTISQKEGRQEGRKW